MGEDKGGGGQNENDPPPLYPLPPVDRPDHVGRGEIWGLPLTC